MKLEEALPLLRGGKGIAQKAECGYTFRLVGNEVHRFNYLGYRVIPEDPTWDDILADDWEVVESEEK